MSKVVGNTVGVPNPKTDWNQTDETKADVILNKPTKLSQFENDVPYAKQGEVDETIIQVWGDMGALHMLINDKADASQIPTHVSELKNDAGYISEHQDISGKADKGTTLAEYGITDAISITREVYEDEIDSLGTGTFIYKVIGSSNNLNYNEVNFSPYYLLVTQRNDKAWQHRIYNGIYQCRDGEFSWFSDTVWNEWKELITSDYTYNKTDIDDKLTVLDGIQADILSLEGSIDSNTLRIVDNTSQINGIISQLFSMNGTIYGLSSDITLMGNTLNELNSIKADKTTIVTDESSTSYTFDFSDMYNKEMRLQAASSISIKFVDNEYAEDYISGLSFNSGETPTRFDYADSGIINWVGTDCSKDGNLSIFQPSANTHYDIVFYFNGVQFIGLVNGFVPATGNEAV